MRYVSSLLMVGLCMSCASYRLRAARAAVAEQSGCPEERLSVWSDGRGWLAEGCDTRYVCEAYKGPCAEDPTDAQRLARARAAFSREAQCPLIDVTVSLEPRGYGAQGCGRYAVCASHDGPCMRSEPPTCRDLARWRYDQCSAQARGNRPHATYANSSWQAANVIASNVLGEMRANKQAEQCQARLDEETAQCR